MLTSKIQHISFQPVMQAVYTIVLKLREFALLLQLGFMFAVGNTLLRLHCARKITAAIMNRAAGVVLPEDLYMSSLFTKAMMKCLWEHSTLDMRKTAFYGQKAPNPLLVDPNTKEEKQLSKSVDVQRLQVLAFGSYTCPVFRLKFKELRILADEFHSVADVSVIYIDEAHPSDGWAFKDDIQISKHRSIEERLNAAQKFSADYCSHTRIRTFADSMKNEASSMYGVNAIRLYVLLNETVVYEGGIGPTYYNVDEVRQAIGNSSSSGVVV